MKTILIALTLLIGNLSFASTNLTITCKVETVGERTDDVNTKNISFDADKSYKNLNFRVYGSEITVGATTYMSEDGKTCGQTLQGICVSLKGSTFCSEGNSSRIYPTDKFAQAGDSTTISCQLLGGEPAPCSVE